MIKTLEKKRWTYKDYAGLDDDKRYEVIKGELIMAPSPTKNHQDFSENLGFLLGKHVRKYRLGKIYHAPFDVILSEDEIYRRYNDLFKEC